MDRPNFPLTLLPAWHAPKQASSITLEKAMFRWTAGTPDGDTQAVSPGFSVGSLSVTFEPGLHLICGPIASGKTLLLLGELGSKLHQEQS